MKLSELRDVVVSLDRAYEEIEGQVSEAKGRRAEEASSQFYYRGGQTRQSTGTRAGVGCEAHGGEAHGFANDGLANSLVQELTPWLWLAGDSAVARTQLGVDSLGADSLEGKGSDARLGAMVYHHEGNDFDLQLATSREAVVSTEGLENAPPSFSTGRLWAPKSPAEMSFRPTSMVGSHRMAVTRDGRRQELAFDRITDGYREYLKGAGRPHGDEAINRFGDCPPPKLLAGAFSADRLRDASRPATRDDLSRVPLGYTESWLSPDRARQTGGMWSQPCEACRFGLGAWACGYDDVRSRVSPKVLTRYRQEEESWDQFLRTTGSEVRRRRDTRTVSGPSAEPRTANEPASIEGATTKIGRAPAIDASKAAAASKTGAEAAIGLANIAAGAGAAGAAGSEAAKDGFYTRAGTFRSDREAIAKGSKSLDRSQWDALLRDSNDARRQNVHIRIQADAFDCEEIEVRSLDGKEAISQLFSFEVLIVCPQEVELGDDHVGVDIAIVFERGGAPARTVHGMITQIDDRLETESEWRSYRLHIAPRLWRATLVSTQEVHVNISVPDLIRQKLELVGLEEGQDFELRLRGTYPVRELIVQYKETDVAFISRLAEHLGICFFFEHGSGVDKLVFSDDNAGFAPLERAEIPFVRQGQRVDVFDIESRRRAFPSRFAMQDYNYRIPTIDLTSTFDTEVGLGGGVVEYGAHYKVPADGVALARLRAEEQAIANRYFLGKSDVAELDPGGRFTLVDHPKIEVPAFLVVEVVHRAVQGVKMTAGAVEPYVNSFRVIDLEMAYRPPRITPRPRIDGVVTALVEPDPSGIVGELAQIDVDGRYTVQFYFDAGDITGKAKHSHPVRMIQPHSGPHYGIHFPLKPGVEVLIVFMDGDPDRPLIIGSVPNPVTPSPVVEQVNLMNRIETASGLIIEMRDAVPPHVK